MKIFDYWQTYAFASAFFAGCVAVLAKIGVANIPSNTATLIRTIVITFFLVAIVSLRGEWVDPSALDKRSFIFLALSGIATGFSWLCYFKALQMGPAAKVASVDKLSLVFAVVMAVLFLGEHLSAKGWGGVILMALGALLVVLK